MAKWSGFIGYAETVETTPGVWTDDIKERHYFGDITRNTKMAQSASQVNDNINISNIFSIVADPYASMNFHSMKYITFMGAKWKITNVEVQYPRLILTVGGLYNE